MKITIKAKTLTALFKSFKSSKNQKFYLNNLFISNESIGITSGSTIIWLSEKEHGPVYESKEYKIIQPNFVQQFLSVMSPESNIIIDTDSMTFNDEKILFISNFGCVPNFSEIMNICNDNRNYECIDFKLFSVGYSIMKTLHKTRTAPKLVGSYIGSLHFQEEYDNVQFNQIIARVVRN